jgi:uncharacterized protein (TIGR00299 family) protein
MLIFLCRSSLLHYMSALVFEPFSGASGDMILGSLLALGVKESSIADALAAVELELVVDEVAKRGVAAKKVAFVTRADTHATTEHTLRSYADIEEAIARSGLSEPIIKNALRVFDRIARAEAAVHGITKERLSFHELGALDTIGDLVGSAAAFLELQPDLIISTPIAVGTGLVKTEHGLMPVPAPATMAILKESALLFQGGPPEAAAELLTPTGAAILAHYVQRSEPVFPQMRLTATGYGAGSMDLPQPNVLRASLGELVALSRDAIEVLETNVDDVTGEVLGNLIEVLMAEGAKDVAITPALMKKGRPGQIIKVITAPQDAARIAHRLMEETGSLGVRVMQVKHRFVADREEQRVTVRFGAVEREVRVKLGRDAQGKVLTVAAEFEDVKRLAQELKRPVQDVLKMVEGTFFYE